MDRNAQKEQFSYAYVRAVATVAGYSVEEKSRPMDNAGIDLTIEAPGEIGEILSPKCDVQVKCTSGQSVLDKKSIKFSLPVNNYNRLRHEKPLAPQILIVVLVPDEISDWINISEEETLMKKCGYWVSLKGRPLTTNTTTISVELPRCNLFTPSNLSLMMEKIGREEEL
jgi:hypothetical protein